MAFSERLRAPGTYMTLYSQVCCGVRCLCPKPVQPTSPKRIIAAINRNQAFAFIRCSPCKVLIEMRCPKDTPQLQECSKKLGAHASRACKIAKQSNEWFAPIGAQCRQTALRSQLLAARAR